MECVFKTARLVFAERHPKSLPWLYRSEFRYNLAECYLFYGRICDAIDSDLSTQVVCVACPRLPVLVKIELADNKHHVSWRGVMPQINTIF